MKAVIGVLAIALIALSVVYYQHEVANSQAVLEHGRVLASMRAQLAVASNQVVAAKTEAVMIRTQLTERVSQLQVTVNTLGSERSQAFARAKELQTRLETAEKDLLEEKSKLASVDDQRTKVVVQLSGVSNQLVSAQQQYANLQKSHQATTAELDLAKGKLMALEQERASLERQLNDLDALQAQIRIVKRRLWDEHVAEWKKRDVEAGVGGNAGVLLKNGQWQTAPKPES